MAPRVDPVATDEALPARADVVIIGGGIIGTSTALFLAQKGVSVALVEKGHIAGEQSSRNWGWCRKMARDPREQFRALFLDRKNTLVADEVQSRGTVDHTPVYPREIVKRALELSASALILVHNHPSGDPTPSRADIEMTRQIAEAAKTLGITVHDHLVIGLKGHVSFKALGLL